MDSTVNAAHSKNGGPDMLNFEELYEKYATDVLRVSYFYLGDRQKAEDVCQDVFMRLMTNTPELEEGREKAWLLKVALNRCRDLWRGAWLKRVVLGSPVFETIPAPDEASRRDEEEAMMVAIHRLPAAFRESILLYPRYFEGSSPDRLLPLRSILPGDHQGPHRSCHQARDQAGDFH